MSKRSRDQVKRYFYKNYVNTLTIEIVSNFLINIYILFLFIM